MKGCWRILGCIALLGAGACGGRIRDDAQSSSPPTFAIRGVEKLDPSDCTPRPNASGAFMDRGALDVAFGKQYIVYALVGNGAADDARNPGGSTSRVTAAEVRVEEDGAQISAFAASVAESTEHGGYQWVRVELLPRDVVDSVRAGFGSGATGATRTLVVHFDLFGTLGDGTAFRTDEVTFPVDVCDLCSLIFPADANDPTLKPSPNCLAKPAHEWLIPRACFQGQDGPTDCRICVGTPACTLCRVDGDCPAGSTCVGAKGNCR